MNFLQRLFFPKTVQLADQQAMIAQRDGQIATLLDALLKNRGEMPAFQVELARSTSPTRPFIAEEDPLLQDAMLREDQRIVDDAVASEDAYMELADWAAEGRPRAQEMLAEVNMRLDAIARAEAARTEVVQ